jgi:hypothetical protein
MVIRSDGCRVYHALCLEKVCWCVIGFCFGVSFFYRSHMFHPE